MIETSKRFARRLLTMVESRFARLMVEVQEGRRAFLRPLLFALGAAAFGRLLAGLALSPINLATPAESRLFDSG